MKSIGDTARKRPYTTPQLTVHGTLEEITKKGPSGASDGFGFNGIVPITSVS
jgi:hypothetical protein